MTNEEQNEANLGLFIRSIGMKKLLEALISRVRLTNTKGEQYLIKLADDLETALTNYNNRYEDTE